MSDWNDVATKWDMVATRDDIRKMGREVAFWIVGIFATLTTIGCAIIIYVIHTNLGPFLIK